MNNSNSPRFSIDGVDVQKVLTGLWVGLAGVAITVLTMLSGATYSFSIGSTDIGPVITLLVSVIFSSLVNLLRKFITDHSAR